MEFAPNASITLATEEAEELTSASATDYLAEDGNGSMINRDENKGACEEDNIEPVVLGELEGVPCIDCIP